MTRIDDPLVCPDPEVVAAFVEGRLDEETLRRIRAHLLTCDECLYIVRGSTEFGHESGLLQPPMEPKRSNIRWMAIAAGVAVAVSVALIVSTFQRNDPITPLNAAIRNEGFRRFEGRLTSVEYERHQVLRSGTAANSPATVAARTALAATEHARAANDWHARAAAELVLGHSGEAVRAMQEAAQLDPKYRADLAAARIALGTERNDPAELRRAVDDADAVLRTNPVSPVALFNRALALERLGENDRAAAAYGAYLSHDGTSDWAAEARWRAAHLYH